MFPFIAAFAAEDADYEWREDVVLALDAAGLSDKQAADIMGITQAQMGAWMNFSGHWSGWRERKLPKEFHVALYTRRLARMDHEVLPKSEILELITSVKRMAKAVLQAPEARRKEIA